VHRGDLDAGPAASEVGADHAGVDGDDGQFGVAALEFVGEQEVGELGAAVGKERLVPVFHVQVVEVDADGAGAEQWRSVAFGVDVDDPAGARAQEGQEAAGHGVGREVVDGEVQLDAFAGGLPRWDHHASVVDQRVEVIDGTLDLRGGVVDPRDGGDVGADHDGGRELFGKPFGSFRIAANENELVPVPRELVGGGTPEARSGADERDRADWFGHRGGTPSPGRRRS
jgi:hypothetical protein